MAIDRIYTYEGLFLFPQTATAHLQEAVDHIKTILERADVELISLGKWDERRLAYEIKGNKRGVYFLVYFKAAASKLAGIERDCNLSEDLLRVMITRADHIPPEIIEAAEGQATLADEIRLRQTEMESVRDEPVAGDDDDSLHEDDTFEDVEEDEDIESIPEVTEL